MERRKIKLNRSFYDEETIKEALNDFKEICEGRIINDGFEVELIHPESIENIDEEFSNYVLGLMKNKIIV